MLDLEAITLRHLTEDKMEGKTFHEGHIVVDLFNCVREVERLRAEVEQERAVVWRGASSPAFIMDAADIERGEHRRQENE